MAVGGALGLLAGLVALAIPGLGPFMVAGPILGALAGAGVGGVVGQVTGALVGMGISGVDAQDYEGRIKKGQVLVAVHAEAQSGILQAEQILRLHGAENVIVTPQGQVKGAP